MPNPALTTYNADGVLVFGYQDVTIGAQPYVVEEGELTFGSDWTVTNNSVAVPNKQFGRATVPTGRFTLQIPASVSAPALFATFTATTLNAVSYTVIIAEVGIRFVNDGVAKLTVGVRYKLN